METFTVSRKERGYFPMRKKTWMHDLVSLFSKSDNAAQRKIQKQPGADCSPIFYLLTDAQLCDQGTVTVDVLLLQVSQHRTALTNHLQQTAA